MCITMTKNKIKRYKVAGVFNRDAALHREAGFELRSKGRAGLQARGEECSSSSSGSGWREQWVQWPRGRGVKYQKVRAEPGRDGEEQMMQSRVFIQIFPRRCGQPVRRGQSGEDQLEAITEAEEMLTCLGSGQR